MCCMQIATSKVENFVLSVEVCPWPVNSFYRSIIEVGLQCFSGSFGIFFQRLHEVSVSADGLSQPPWTRIIVPGVNVEKPVFFIWTNKLEFLSATSFFHKSSIFD
jgi:hypothetical protein